MWIVASNFIVPDLLSLAQLIVIFLGPRYNVDIYVFSLFFVNPCVEIISVLFATVWAARNHWQADEDSPPPTFSLGLGSNILNAPSESIGYQSRSQRAHSVIYTAPLDIQEGIPEKPTTDSAHFHGPCVLFFP